MTDLNRNQELLLKAIKNQSEPSTSQLYENETIGEIYKSQRSLSTVLKRLEEEQELVESDPDGRSKSWTLTSKGHTRLRKIYEEERNRIEEDRMKDDLDYQKAVNEFYQYFRGPGKQSLTEDVIEDGHSAVYLDYQNIAEHVHADIADHLIRNPEDVLSACRDAIRRLSFIEEPGIDVRVENVFDFETKTISELSAQDMGRLVVIEGILRSVSAPQVEEVEAVFECTNCGDRIRSTNQKRGEIKDPYSCDCGCEHFDKVDVTQKTVRYLNLQEKPSRGNRQTVTAKLVGNLARDESQNLKATGSGIKVIGYLETYRKRKRDEALRLRLRANNLEIEEDKWEDIDITDDEKEQVQEIAERDDLRNYLVRSFASDRVRHMDLLKEAHLLWFLGRTESDGNLHCLAVGEPGLGKSEIGKYVHKEYPKVLKAVGTGTSAVGLTASVTKDEVTGDWVAEAGKLAMADGAFVVTDEIDKVSSEDMEKMNEALSEETITLDKANIHTELSADVSAFALGNPEGKYFDPNAAAYEQIPIDNGDFQDRFDIVLALRRRDIEEQENEEKEREIARLILNRGQDSVEPGELGGYSEDELVSKEMMIKYLYVAQQLSPTLSQEAKDRILDLYIDFKKTEGETENLWDRRRLVSLKKLSIAYARLYLDETVREEHVKLAADFMKRCFESLDFQLGKDDFNEFRQSLQSSETDEKSKRDELYQAIDHLASRSPDSLAFVDEIQDRLGWEADEIEKYAEQLKKDMMINEPMDNGGYEPI